MSTVKLLAIAGTAGAGAGALLIAAAVLVINLTGFSVIDSI